ncbi:FadR/GntR family transcriptional regulator [Clostridioides difficile]|uniref:GntR family transcriptional regulator n=2 Tax=Clostridioides difficile TaxID=1496 RepID=A0AAX3GZL8_CLODI|nr:FadR/GntR family transcriptional regulator [Clostridioides difficile]AVD35672.1 FadR family transcriptional regulator [Clostridioides difficile]AVD40882.1 FadR family transcriptional regulator [Clostridioides difficile]AVD44390.1 FadR family transcriptional regulator [Clostridioides difficile]AXU67496.1 GntR family transcriptional regulator [Clostridioides difficile]AXU89667.1 GntR family transcriptional regulator [Clostridioides difficile]
MFNSIASKKVYEQVIEQIQYKILNGELKKGDKLLSERELSEQMNVSRTSIREAIRVLETMGVIESRQGEGNFICTNIEKTLIEPLSMIFKLNNGTLGDILELRIILEIEIAKLASKRITSSEAIELKNIIDEMRVETNKKDNNRVLVLLDQKFHSKLATLSKNYLIQSLFMTASKLFDGFIEDAREKIIAEPFNENILLKQHEAIYNAVVENDVELACEKAKEHMDFISKNYRKNEK